MFALLGHRTDCGQIRCSGFDQSEDGRCTNCQRFSQECIFTPVSAQAQAFVPAHTVWRGQNPPQGAQLYGAYGQPLPQHGGRDPYQQAQPGQYPPPPQGYQQPPPMYQQPPQQQTPGSAGLKRLSDEPHTPTLPPPNPGAQAPMGRPDGQYSYPDPAGLPAGASPASSTASFNSAQPSYYIPYHDDLRASSSPHSLGQPGSYAPPPTSYSSQPPVASQRPGVRINEMISPAAQLKQQQLREQAQAAVKQEDRTTHDTSMVSALSRGHF